MALTLYIITGLISALVIWVTYLNIKDAMAEGNKKSEELRKQAAEEDNDLKAFGLIGKANRESRNEDFIEKHLPLLKAKFTVEEKAEEHKYTLTTPQFGTIDFWPKSNKVLIRKKNKYIPSGLKWLVANLLNEPKK